MNVGDIVELRWKSPELSEWVAMYTGRDYNTAYVFDYFYRQDLGVVLRFGESYGGARGHAHGRALVEVMVSGKVTSGWVPANLLKVVK